MTDVVVVGYGPAGAAAAIAAHDEGCRVTVLEAAPHGGGNALYSGGFLFDAPPELTVDHLDGLCFGRTDLSVLKAYANGLHDLDHWLASLGGRTVPFDPPAARLPVQFPSWPNLAAGRRVRYRLIDDGTTRPGVALWRVLDAAVRERGIDVRFGVPVRRLLVQDEGTVRGVAGAEDLQADAVVLACGGFEGDPGLTDAYLPLGPVRPVGHLTNTGAGLRMAQSVGAALWHMYGFFGWFAFQTEEFPVPFPVDFFGPSHLFVDAEGRRFADETGYEVHDRLRALLTYLPRNANRPRLPTWAVFDEATRLAGPLNGLLGSPNDYVWSGDNSAEVTRGWIRSASGPEELATRMGVDPAVFASTLRTYNAAASAGRDDAFGRSPDTLVPLETNRLYAIPTWPGIAGTTGGPRHDADGRVLRPDGEPIPGLYAAGAVSLVWGHLIEHGGGLTDALVFGRIAGVRAAADVKEEA